MIVWNDLAAWGVNQAAIAAGRRVPADLSIICFDQSNISNFLSFRPTVVDVRPEEMSRRAAEMLLNILAGESDGEGILLSPGMRWARRPERRRKRSNAAKVRTDRRSEVMKSFLQFDENDWERTERNWTAWWQGELDRPMVMIETMAAPAIPSTRGMRSDPVSSDAVRRGGD